MSCAQEVLGHLGRQQLGQLLQEMIVAMHGIAAYPRTPSDGQVHCSSHTLVRLVAWWTASKSHARLCLSCDVKDSSHPSGAATCRRHLHLDDIVCSCLQADGSEDECIGCFSLFQFSANTDGPSLEAALAAASRPRRIQAAGAAGGGHVSGSDSESGDDIALEVNSWWLEHLEERVRLLQALQ